MRDAQLKQCDAVGVAPVCKVVTQAPVFMVREFRL